MKISAIVSMASNRVIGNRGKIPWHLSEDLKRFKRITLNSSVIMGRKTFESIGHPLPNRENIILSRDIGYDREDCVVLSSLSEALEYCRNREYKEIFIIGGGELYKEALPLVDVLHITKIHEDFEGDAYFPEIDYNDWELEYYIAETQDPSVEFFYSFKTLVRK